MCFSRKKCWTHRQTHTLTVPLLVQIFSEYSERVTFKHKHFKDTQAAFQVLLYQPHYTCNPPAIITLLLSVVQVKFQTMINYKMSNFPTIQVLLYVWHNHWISRLVTDPVLSSQAPVCSVLIYNPTRRQEVWRYLTYQFVHVNMEHIVFNTLMQLVVGLPLEMSQPGYLGTFK